MNTKIFLALLAVVVVSNAQQSETVIIKSDLEGVVLGTEDRIVTQNTYVYPRFTVVDGFPVNGVFPVEDAIWIWNQYWNPQDDLN